jgi:hypothetical protein
MKLPALALALGLVLARPALATVIEVPVPELAGTRSCAPLSDSSCAQTVVIHLPAIPAVVRSVSLRVLGTTTFAWFSCGASGQPYTVPTSFIAYGHKPGYFPADSWLAHHTNTTPGPIACTEPFEPLSGTWAFLSDGALQLDFLIDATGPIDDCNLAGPRDSTTLDSVTLLVDGDFPTPTVRSSWGHLKAIYR